MNILFSCDTNYAMPLTVCVTSLFENNKTGSIEIYVLHSNLTASQTAILESLAKAYKQNIHIISVDKHYFQYAPTLRWSKETYYRLLINELLPANLNRILYLDCDIIIDGPIRELYVADLGSHYMAALPEKNNILPRERLGLKLPGGYFQAGVILFDLSKCRTILNYEKANQIITSLGQKLEVVDQDVMNVMFDGLIAPIDTKWNNSEITNCRRHTSTGDTCIYHFATGKPWNNLYAGSCEEIWYRYLKLSPYKDLYTNKYNTLRYKLLRTRVMKGVFRKYIDITPRINNFASKIFPSSTYASLKNIYRKKIK